MDRDKNTAKHKFSLIYSCSAFLWCNSNGQRSIKALPVNRKRVLPQWGSVRREA